MAEHKSRPTGIHIENCENVTLTDNVGVGDMDFIVAKNSTNIHGSGNKHFNPSQETAPPEKRWFEKPLGLIAIGLFITVGGGAILYFFGLH